MSTLEFDSVEKIFNGHSILSDIYIKCEAGQVVGLLGRNGSGKSTLMKAVFGSLRVSFKSVRLDQKPLLGNYIRRQVIGYLPQHDWLPPNTKVREALKHFEIHEDLLVQSFPSFSDWMNFSNRQLSGGYQRVFEVFLLLHSVHKFVLLDEPFPGLMPKHIEDIKGLITNAKSKKGIIISDHLYRHILDLADHTYLLANGKTYLVNSQDDLVFRGYLLE